MRLVKLSATIVVTALIIVVVVRFGNDVLIYFESDSPSKSTGTPAGGSLSNGKRLPSAGANYRTYSYLGSFIGRTCVHEKLRKAIIESYNQIHYINPNLSYVFAEGSWPNGGRLYPHKTHKNGLAVDFLVPVKNKNGDSKPLPTTIFNEYGYGYDFDQNGNSAYFEIDFEALALHLSTLHEACRRNGIYINLVAIAPEYLPMIFNSQAGKQLEGKFPFYRQHLEERHDEHYHIIFSNPDY